MEAHAPADLRDALALTPVTERPGLYRGGLDHSWSFVLPSGGVLTSLALAAMRLELTRRGVSDLVPVAATATFCSAIAEGPLDIEVVVLRAGRTASQLRAHLRPRGQLAAPGDVGLEVTATFVLPRELEGVTDTDFIPFPKDVPPPEACETYDPAKSGVVPPNFYKNLIVQKALGDVWWSKTWAPGEARVARYYRYHIAPALPDGSLDPLALPPIADTMASAVHQAVGSKKPPMLFPSLDLTLHFVAPLAGRADHPDHPDLPDLPTQPILVDARATAIFSSSASASANVWQGKRLLMTATQTMTLRYFKPRA